MFNALCMRLKIQYNEKFEKILELNKTWVPHNKITVQAPPLE